MSSFVGIYGFDITRTVQLDRVQIVPVFADWRASQQAADAEHQFVLTAIGEIDRADAAQLVFDLAAALTFCQQRWIIVTAPFQPRDLRLGLEAAKAELPEILEFQAKRVSNGPLIVRDVFLPDSRATFLRLCLDKLSDEIFDKRTGLRAAFFRAVECLRMQWAPIDVTYYLLFSAMEILVRRGSRSSNGSFARAASDYLKSLGFDVEQDNPSRRTQSMQTYADLRNALFHQGKLESTKTENGHTVTLKLTDFSSNWQRLVDDAILKVIDFDD